MLLYYQQVAQISEPQADLMAWGFFIRKKVKKNFEKSDKEKEGIEK